MTSDDYEPFQAKGLFSFNSAECDYQNIYSHGIGQAAVYHNQMYTPMLVAEGYASHSGCTPASGCIYPFHNQARGNGYAEHTFGYKSERYDGTPMDPSIIVPVVVKYRVGISLTGYEAEGLATVHLLAGTGYGQHSVAYAAHEQSYAGTISGSASVSEALWVKMTVYAMAWAVGYIYGEGVVSTNSRALTILDPYVYIDPASPLADEMQILIWDLGTHTYVPQIYINIFNEPPVADANGPYETTEGSEITFDASASTDQDEDELQYRWDFENDGTWDTDWSSDPTATHTWYDDHVGTAVVEVSDGEETDTSTADVTVNNAPPVAAIDSMMQPFPTFILPTDELTFTGSFADPGTSDTHTIEWSFGDGATATGMLTPTHAYESAGDYTVTLTVTDDNGGVDTASYPVTVKTSKESIGVVDEYITSQKLPKGVKDSLHSILDAAIISLDNGQTNAAVNQLVAFMYLVEALRDVKLSNVQADTLQSEAQWIIDYLSG